MQWRSEPDREPERFGKTVTDEAELIAAADPAMKAAARPLWQEAKELHLIFAAIHRR